MRSLFIAALLFASAANAATLSPAVSRAPSVILSQAGTTGGDEEDEEDEDEEDTGTTDTGAGTTGTGTGTDTGATGTGTGTTPGAEPGTAATGTGATGTAPTAATSARAQELVSGAPLYNPNVAVHIVEKKQFSDRGKHELVLFPAASQINGKFTQHFGTALSYVYHLHENFGFSITPQFNWFNSESAFNEELINKVREEAQAATSLLLNWGVLAGVEVTPIYGKFAWYEDSLAHYSVVLTGGAGYGSTRHQLKPNNDAGPATFGDTGNRFIGGVGGGFRVLFGNRFAVRLEVRDIVYTARVDTVNGCDALDLKALDDATRAGRDPMSANTSAACRKETFAGQTDDGQSRQTDIPLAYSLVRDPTSDVLNLVSFYGGVSFLF